MAVGNLCDGRMVRRQCGVALLLVLAMIILIVPLAVDLAQISTLTRLEERLSSQESLASALRRAIESGPMQEWLSSQSGHIVLDPTTPTPCVTVLDQLWILDGMEYAFEVHGWDQCGMVPFGAPATVASLRAALPGPIERQAAAVEATKPAGPIGLDQFRVAVDATHSLRVFPTDARDTEALGAFIATHPPRPEGMINVNTAPLTLIEAAMALAGRSGIELITASREQHKPAPVPTALPGSPRGVTGSGAAPQFAGSSSAWAFRIDVHVGRADRSWWVVYLQRAGRWECVQRLVIPG